MTPRRLFVVGAESDVQCVGERALGKWRVRNARNGSERERKSRREEKGRKEEKRDETKARSQRGEKIRDEK